MRKYEDGWHKISGIDVYIENDMIVRSITADWSQPLYLYEYDKKMNVLTKVIVTVPEFRRKIREGKIYLR